MHIAKKKLYDEDLGKTHMTNSGGLQKRGGRCFADTLERQKAALSTYQTRLSKHDMTHDLLPQDSESAPSGLIRKRGLDDDTKFQAKPYQVHGWYA